MYPNYGSPYGSYGYPPIGGYMPMVNTYTPTGGYTPQMVNSASFMNTLNNMPRSTTGTMDPGAAKAVSQAQTMQAAEAPVVQQAQQQLYQQSGAPQTMNQYSNLAGAFKMWLADQNLAQKYSSGQNTNPWANQSLVQAGGGNPYNAPTDQIAASTQGSGSGFASPSLTTAAMAEPMAGATNMLNLLNNVLTGQNQAVSNYTGYAAQNYQNAINALLGTGNILQNQANINYQLGQNAVNVPGTVQNAASTYQTLKDNYVKQAQSLKQNPTWDGFWYYLNSQKNALGAQGVDVSTLYKLQGEDRGQFGGDANVLSGSGTVATPAQKQAQSESDALAALKGFGNMVDAYQSIPQVNGIGVNLPFGNESNYYNSQKDIYVRQLQKALSSSKGLATANAYAKNLPGEGLNIGALGAFQGHLQQVLDANKMRLVKDKQGNLGVVTYQDYNPKTESEVKTSSLSMPQMVQFLNSL